MFAVIFRAKTKKLDGEYTQILQQMRDLVLGEFGCLEFQAASEEGK